MTTTPDHPPADRDGLLPCPFCGGKIAAQGATGHETISVWCMGCAARGPEVPFPSINIKPSEQVKECRDLWNKRAPTPPIAPSGGRDAVLDRTNEILKMPSPQHLSPEEKMIWILGDLMNAAENYFGAENPKRSGHIYGAANRLYNEVLDPLLALRPTTAGRAAIVEADVRAAFEKVTRERYERDGEWDRVPSFARSETGQMYAVQHVEAAYVEFFRGWIAALSGEG